MSQADSNKNRIAEDIIGFAADSLMIEMRSVRPAINEIHFNCDNTIDGFSVNGSSFNFEADKTIEKYLNNKNALNRTVLHSIFHCIFRHIFRTENKDSYLWDLACDISCENAIIEADIDCTSSPEDNEKKSIIYELKEKTGSITADNLYYYFSEKNIDIEVLNRLCSLFFEDCHDIWYRKNRQTITEEDSYSENGETPSIYKRADDRPSRGEDEQGQTSGDNGSRKEDSEENKWERIAKKVTAEAEFEKSQRGNSGGNFLQELEEFDTYRYDYSDFLRQFAVTGEAMEIDDSEFDYIYYTYGMSLYENMPLIEPLEYSESNKIRNFVIAIDTSGSVKGKTVQKFIEKTYHILKNTDLFFENVNIHIIQCDAAIQNDTVIHNEKEMNEYISDIRLQGFGGTDFRPVFDYIDRLTETKTIEKLSGLIYFTDGDGIYPKSAPKYKTAFILYGKNIKDSGVPSWACKTYLRDNELEAGD